MEYGFYHPNRGYWQTTNYPSEEIIATYPAGTVEVPIKPGADHKWDGAGWVYVAPAPTVPQVISKLQAELAAGQAVVAQIEAYMNDPTSPWAMQRAWASATELHRTSQTVDELAYVLGWTSQQVDDLFIAAAQISV